MDTPFEEPPHLRLLRRLVTVLTVVMIFGLLTIVAVIVMRFTGSAPPGVPVLPATLTLPEGERAEAVTMGQGWVAVVTRGVDGTETIRVFAPDGTPMQSLEIGGTE